jgi:urease accessory protein
VQKLLYPEGERIAHCLILHPPGGMVAGDRLAVSLEMKQGTHGLFTMPGAGKLYRSNGGSARYGVEIDVAAGAVVEWLPPELIVYDGAIGETSLSVRLAHDAVFVGWDIVCWGRPAAGEAYSRGHFRFVTAIDHDGRALWRERGVLAGSSPVLHSATGLAGASVSATMIVAGRSVDSALLAASRDVPAASDARVGVTRMPNLCVARFVGNSAEGAREYFVRLWRLLRPVFIGRAAALPRIWKT